MHIVICYVAILITRTFVMCCVSDSVSIFMLATVAVCSQSGVRTETRQSATCMKSQPLDDCGESDPRPSQRKPQPSSIKQLKKDGEGVHNNVT